jgi:hypothetical protein
VLILRIGERYLELFLFRLKLFLSVEGVLVFGLLLGSSRIRDMIGIETPSRWANYSMFILHQIGYFVSFLAIAFAVYALGELERKKFKLKSILFNYTGSDEVKQKIISLMQENPSIAVGEIADIVGLYIGHTEDYIRELKKSGLVQQEGKLKNRQWIVK